MHKQGELAESTPKNFSLFQLTSILLSSKHDELDEKIPLIKDLSRYYIRILPQNRNPPTYNEVVDCEKQILMHFDWNLMILIPSHFVKVFLANGVVFDNETQSNISLSKRVQDQCQVILETVVKNQTHFYNKAPSLMGSLVIYCSRKMS
mmetsp:Transcript_33423/g.32475  ORF Transcript_33423/g.32475 Transcript_33423/m.32475 type:complete len:149 (+) Transcript_33423:383-829(+)